MAATRLPDGSVVMQPSGQRAIPSGGRPGKRSPAVAVGPGGGGNKNGRVGVTSRQPGRGAVSKNGF
jgi:hypothetical protein